ncbi:MAG: ABC transporter permease, partial [Oscillospiraceae bacterium]|nr:ABC transporter permease [Oscillospiraceae bacterium]
FLELADRASLSVRITDRTVLFGAVGIIISFLYMLLPVIRLSKIGIVESKRLKSNRNKKPLWEKYFLDVIAFAVSVYMLYNFHIQRWNIATTFQDERAFDPVMFFGSSLFIIGTALLLLRLYPYLMKLILLVGRNKFGPSIYTSIVKVSRSGGGEQLIMLFLVFTVAVGIFSAQTARTLNRNNEHRIRYTGGADITILEDWMDNMISEIHVAMGFSQPKFLVYREPDFNRFLEYEEVVSATRVLKQLALIRYGISRVEDATLLGIETDTFGETVWFRRGLSPIHINYFLNALAQNPNGVILSSNFRKLGYNIDNDIIITAPQKHGPSMVGEFKIVGFVDYWPSFKPTEVERLETGEVVFVDNYLAVANIEHLNSLIGVRPYQVWMKTDDSSHQFIYDFAEENVAFVRIIHDNDRSLLKILTDPVIQSTNGFLSIGFIMTMILCFAGFLIYWILSIKERLLQFGVFRAMGMGMRGIIGILVGEQILITVIALVIGGVIGEVTSQFYVPLLQISYTAADQVIPLMIVRSAMDFITIYGISGFMLVLSVIILVRYTLRMNVTQVLKLGED